jgi:predicted nucleic acid-binding protein
VADYYLDSSALVKSYVAETGTKWVRTILDDGQNSIFISSLAEVEVVAALTRRYRVGDLTVQQLDQACDEVRQDAETYISVPLTNNLIRAAVGLARTHGLRGYDAVQFATALEVRDALMQNQLGQDFTLVSADHELNAVAALEGLQVEDPNTH